MSMAEVDPSIGELWIVQHGLLEDRHGGGRLATQQKDVGLTAERIGVARVAYKGPIEVSQGLVEVSVAAVEAGQIAEHARVPGSMRSARA